MTTSGNPKETMEFPFLPVSIRKYVVTNPENDTNANQTVRVGGGKGGTKHAIKSLKRRGWAIVLKSHQNRDVRKKPGRTKDNHSNDRWGSRT